MCAGGEWTETRQETRVGGRQANGRLVSIAGHEGGCDGVW